MPEQRPTIPPPATPGAPAWLTFLRGLVDRDRAWLIAVIVAMICATFLAVRAPDQLDKLLRLFDHLPSEAQIAGALGALATVVAIVRGSGKGGSALVLVLALCAATLGTGCGASALDTHYQVLGAIASVYDTATDGAEVTLTAQAAACSDDACVEGLRSIWAPIQAGGAAVLLALQGYAAALRLWRDAGDLPALARAAVRSLAAIGSAWDAWAVSARAAGWVTLPTIPPEALALVSGGAP